jgi:periplasmic divalent cation tolerance protein
MVTRMPTGYYLVLTTCPHEEAARALAAPLIDARLAACINIVPGVHSIYRWKGRIEEGRECMLLIKTTRDRYPALEQHIRTAHPYELPEIVAMELTAGSADYLAWISEGCRVHAD